MEYRHLQSIIHVLEALVSKQKLRPGWFWTLVGHLSGGLVACRALPTRRTSFPYRFELPC